MKVLRIILFPILLIGGYGAILFWADLKAAKSANTSSARDAMSQLIQASEDFYFEYQQLPLGSTTNIDAVQLTIGKGSKTVMTALCSTVSAADESYKERNLFVFREAVNGKNGLVRNEEGTYAELFDPWGSPYHVLFNYDYDDELRDPFTGKIIKNQKVLIWSPGPDGKSGTADDICSWK